MAKRAALLGLLSRLAEVEEIIHQRSVENDEALWASLAGVGCPELYLESNINLDNAYNLNVYSGGMDERIGPIECARLCNEDENCVAFEVHAKGTGHCKTKSLVRSAGYKDSDWESCVKAAAATCPPDYYRASYNLGNDADLAVHLGVGKAACAKLCTNDPQCDAFEVGTRADGECKTKKYVEDGGERNPDWDSCIKVTCPMHYRETTINLSNDANLEVYPGIGLEACGERCNADPECDAFEVNRRGDGECKTKRYVQGDGDKSPSWDSCIKHQEFSPDKVKILLWTPEQRFNPADKDLGNGARAEFNPYNPTAMDLSTVWPHYDPTRKDPHGIGCTKIVIHGFGAKTVGDKYRQWNMGYLMSEAYFRHGYDCNVIGIHWLPLAENTGNLLENFGYDAGARNVLPVGTYVAEFLATVLFKQGGSPNDIHCIGHSLGGQMCGRIGREILRMTGQKIARISALDPAGPLWIDGKLRRRPAELRNLDPGPGHDHVWKTDAQFVDTHHTNGKADGPMFLGGMQGSLLPSGHVDFFYNGGERMPGCSDHPSYYPRNTLSGCSHWAAVFIFAQSIGYPQAFEAKICYSWDECRFFWRKPNEFDSRPVSMYGGEHGIASMLGAGRHAPYFEDTIDPITQAPFAAYKQYNHYYKPSDGVGDHGGMCSCPDGSKYAVGDEHNWCGSLACDGGSSGTCNAKVGKWSGMKVKCAPAAGTGGWDWNGQNGLNAYDTSTYAFFIRTETLTQSMAWKEKMSITDKGDYTWFSSQDGGPF